MTTKNTFLLAADSLVGPERVRHAAARALAVAESVLRATAGAFVSTERVVHVAADGRSSHSKTSSSLGRACSSTGGPPLLAFTAGRRTTCATCRGTRSPGCARNAARP